MNPRNELYRIYRLIDIMRLARAIQRGSNALIIEYGMQLTRADIDRACAIANQGEYQ